MENDDRGNRHHGWPEVGPRGYAFEVDPFAVVLVAMTVSGLTWKCLEILTGRRHLCVSDEFDPRVKRFKPSGHVRKQGGRLSPGV